jgi:hypothetical protein
MQVAAQAEMAKLYGSQGALAQPGYGVPQGVMPQAWGAPEWPDYQLAASQGMNYAQPPVSNQSAAMQIMQAPQPSQWEPSGEMFGMRGFKGLGATSAGPVGAASTPGFFGGAASFITSIADPVANVVSAATGRPRVAAQPAYDDSGPGLGTILTWGAIGVGAWYVGKKLLGGKGSKKSSRKRR